MDNSLKSLEYDSTESYADYGGTAQQNHSSDILGKKKDIAFSVCPKTKNFRKFKRKRLMPLAIEIPTQPNIPNIDSVASSLVIALIQADSE